MIEQVWKSGFTRSSDIEFRELLEQLPAATYTTDGEGLITYFNQHAVDLWGRTPKLRDPVDRFCGSFLLFTPDGAPIPHAECWMALALRDRRAYNGHEIVIERADGSRRTVLAHANPLHDERGGLIGAVNVLVDITDRKDAELQLRQADGAKTQFLAVLAHELRNPLAPMRSAVELLRRTGDESGRVAVDMLGRQIQHLTRIVDDLLDVSRISRNVLDLRRERIELAPVVEHAVETCRPMFEARGQKLEVVLPDAPVWLIGDADRLAQLFGNLLANASKYSDPDGQVRIGAERMGSEAVVSVRDHGMGIAPDVLPAIFEMFARGDAGTQDGLGVGLTLAQRLAEMHDGFIEVRSAGPGQGSEFRVHLPVLALATPRRAPAPLPTRAYRGHRILIVDDNRDAAFVLAELLQLEQNETHVAHDGAAAVELAATLEPEAVLLDLGLPRIDGYEAARRIRALPRGNEMTLVALTGWGQPEDRERSSEAGFDHHLVKPVDLAALMNLLASGNGAE